ITYLKTCKGNDRIFVEYAQARNLYATYKVFFRVCVVQPVLNCSRLCLSPPPELTPSVCTNTKQQCYQQKVSHFQFTGFNCSLVLPNLRSRCWYARIASYRSSFRKSGHKVEVIYSSVYAICHSRKLLTRNSP